MRCYCSSHFSAHAQELRRILYGVSTSISHLPVWVGKDTGLFAKNGLNIEPVQIRGGAVSTMAIMSGQAVLSGVGAGSVVAARVEGGDIVLLACPADLEPVYLIARPEIKSRPISRGKRPESPGSIRRSIFISVQRRAWSASIPIKR